ncbi:MAG: YHS domain-containing (seleno)protein [Acidiferrobacterales bacterium]
MIKRPIAILIALSLLAPLAYAKPPVFATSKGAIRGFDAVAYFMDGKPVKGNTQYSAEWNGAKWFFATPENRGRFAVDPSNYAPQYGGYCAYAVANGYTASTDPDAWSIVEGKLYLNYSLGVREKWQEDIPGNIASANKNWPGVLR